MTVPTQPVTVRLADFGGPSVAGVRVTARLSDIDYTADGTIVATAVVIEETDDSGVAVLNVFPNAVTPTGLGTRGTTIRFTASIPGSKPLNVNAVIPDAPCNLLDHVVDDDPEGLTASQLAAADAQASRDAAATSATASAGSATAAAGSASAAAGSATAADASATSASGSASAASGSATAAAGSASAAASSATAASNAQTAAETARDAANAASRIYASTAAGLAGTTSGQYFYVVSATSSESLLLYLNNAGSAVLQKTLSSLDGDFGTAQEIVGKAVPLVRNMFNPAAITDSSYVKTTDGTLGSNASFFATDYIPVIPNSSLVSSHASYSAAGQGLAYYDAGKNYVSGSTTALAAGVAITIPSNVRYIRISYRHSVVTDLTRLMILNATALPAMVLPYGEFDWATNALALMDDFRARAAISRIDPDRITAGSALRFASGVVDASAGVFITNYIPVAPGGTLKTSPASTGVSGVYGMAWYDRNKNYISGVGGPFTDGQTFTAPNNAAYARFTVSNTQLSTFLVLPSSITPGHAYTHTPAKISDFKQWVGKQIMNLGDSISANYNWGSALCTYLGATQAANNALGGRKMIDALKTPGGVALTAADFTNVDAVILFLGTNDWGNNTALGTISDSTATASFFGYTKLAIETMLGWKPTLRIVVCTLLQRNGGTTANGVGKVLNDYAQALRDCAELYALPILDFNKVSGINPLTFSTYLSDGLHPIVSSGYTGPILNPAKGFFDRTWPAN